MCGGENSGRAGLQNVAWSHPPGTAERGNVHYQSNECVGTRLRRASPRIGQLCLLDPMVPVTRQTHPSQQANTTHYAATLDNYVSGRVPCIKNGGMRPPSWQIYPHPAREGVGGTGGAAARAGATPPQALVVQRGEEGQRVEAFTPPVRPSLALPVRCGEKKLLVRPTSTSRVA
eukprot:365910-Chlamydomonas_euryale.AAC.34